MVPLASSACQRIRVWPWPRLAVFVRVAIARSVPSVGATTPSATQSAPLLVEIDTVMFEYAPPL